MARPGVGQDEVVRVAIRLLSQGKSPSVRNVWRGLGERGSFETISKHLEAWRAGLSEATLEVLPPTLPPALLDPLEALWTVAVQEAASQYADARAAAEAATAQAQALRHEAEQAAGAASQEAAQLRAELAHVRESLEAEQARSQDLVRQLDARDAELGQLRRAQADEQRMQEERARLLQEDVARQQQAYADKLRALEARVQAEVDRGEAQERHWLRLLDEARVQTKAIDLRAIAREQELLAQLAERTQQLDAVQAQRLAAEAKLEARSEERDRLLEQNNALTRRWQQEAAERKAEQQAHSQRLETTWQHALEHAEQVLLMKKVSVPEKLQQLRTLKTKPPALNPPDPA